MAFLAAIKKRTDLRAKGVAKEADDRDPTTVSDTPWIGELDPKRFTELPSGGKWMHFYDRSKLWRHWKKCQELYRANKLRGVSNMKVSTMHSHHHSSNVGVIILYCGPVEDEQKVKEIGRNILLETGYTSSSKKMFYKTDTQTLSGRSFSHKYELPIPQENFDKLKINNKSTDEYKQQDNNDNTPYTRQYLESKSRQQLIQIIMKLQEDTTSKNKKGKKKRKYPKKVAPIPNQGGMNRPKPPLRLLQEIEKKGKKVAPIPNQRGMNRPKPPLSLLQEIEKKGKKKAPIPNQGGMNRPKPPLNLLQEIKKKGKKKKKIKTRVRTRDGKVYTETIDADGTVSRKLQAQEALPQYLSANDATTKQLPSYIYSASDKKWIPVKHENEQTNDDAVEQKEDKNGNDVKELTIVSYNIWFADREWQERQQKLLEMLEEINPDIFCLQEVTPRFLTGFCDNKYIQNNFELSDEKDNFKLSTISPYGVMIGCNRNKNKLSMMELKICALSSNMGRKLVSSCIKLNDKQTLWINTVHLESLMNADVRIDQLKNIFNVYMKDQGDAMLMGDFNFGDFTKENNYISKEFMDCFAEYKKVLMNNNKNDDNNKKGNVLPKKFERGSTCFGSRYDRILLRSDRWNIQKFEIIGKENMPSDHLGVVTNITTK